MVSSDNKDKKDDKMIDDAQSDAQCVDPQKETENHNETEESLNDFQKTQAEKDLQDILNATDNVEQAFPLSIEESLKKDLMESQEQVLRSLAEVENIRKRSQREKQDAATYAITNFARDMLSVTDNMSRALSSLQEKDKDNVGDNIRNLIIGIEMISKEVHTIFERHGIHTISPLGEKFNPNFHQAMFETETDEYEVGHIMQIISDGYMIKDRVLRPAMVGVAKAKQETDITNESPSLDSKKSQGKHHNLYEDQKSDNSINDDISVNSTQKIDKNV